MAWEISQSFTDECLRWNNSKITKTYLNYPVFICFPLLYIVSFPLKFKKCLIEQKNLLFHTCVVCLMYFKRETFCACQTTIWRRWQEVHSCSIGSLLSHLTRTVCSFVKLLLLLNISLTKYLCPFASYVKSYKVDRSCNKYWSLVWICGCKQIMTLWLKDVLSSFQLNWMGLNDYSPFETEAVVCCEICRNKKGFRYYSHHWWTYKVKLYALSAKTLFLQAMLLLFNIYSNLLWHKL